MALVRPTINRLIARAKSDIETRLPGADAKIRRTTEYVLAIVSAGMAHGLHGHLVWISKQIMPDTAVDELMVRWASIWGIARDAAVKATGTTIDITGTNGTVCPDTTVWESADGETYVQDGDETIAAGIGTIEVEASDGGDDGNQIAGVTLSLVTPISGIDSDATVGGTGITGGIDQQSLASLLVELLNRLRNPPKGGGPGDYVTWALEVAGCTRAWQYPNADGAGTVAVLFVQDDDSVSIIPDAGEVAAMQTHQDGKAPVTANVTVYAPTQKTLNITASITPNTAAVKAAAQSEIEDLLLREGKPAATIFWSWLNEAMSIAAGETDHTITIPAADVTHVTGEMPKLGTITWT